MSRKPDPTMAQSNETQPVLSMLRLREEESYA